MSVAGPKSTTAVGVTGVDTSDTGRGTVVRGPEPTGTGVPDGVLLGVSLSDKETLVSIGRGKD